jgi:hypothetical protein
VTGEPRYGLMIAELDIWSAWQGAEMKLRRAPVGCSTTATLPVADMGTERLAIEALEVPLLGGCIGL